MADQAGSTGVLRNPAIRWMNFRGFEDTGWLPLRPITLLIGPNNAGKTSVLAPLLLLKQTLLSRTGRDALMTRGVLANYGSYRDLVYNHEVDRQVSLGLRWHTYRPRRGLEPVGSYPPGSLELTFRESTDGTVATLDEYTVRDVYRRIILRRTRKEDGSYSLRMARPRPGTRVAKMAGAQRKASLAMRKAMREAQPVDFQFISSSVRRAAYDALESAPDSAFPFEITDDRVRLYLQIIEYVALALETLFDDLYYVGPLREPPHRTYELSGEMPPDVGTRGEFAPEIVYRWRDEPEKIALVREWLQNFGFEQELRWKARGEDAFSLVMARTRRSREVDFADIGFGISQVLPLIVQGFAAPPRSWVVMEQPEIHLNPRLQTVLANLFKAFADRSVRVLVETHSEHLLLRLRRLVAAGEIAARDVGVLYVQRGAHGSTVERVPVDSTGHIPSDRWPKGFFAEALEESLALAELQLGAADAQ